MVSDDEPEDHVEEDSDCNDEEDSVEVNYADFDVAEAISLELDLIGASSTQPQLIAEEAGPAPKKKRGRPKKNPRPVNSALAVNCVDTENSNLRQIRFV